MKLRVVAFLAVLSCPVLASAEVKVGDRAINVDKHANNGLSTKLSALRGKVVLVDFWASWCEPCKREIPLLGKLAARLHDRGIEVVTVNIDDDAGKAQGFLRDTSVQGLTVVRDDDKSIVGAWEPPKMPTSFVVDKQGIVRAVNAGFDEGDERKIEQQLLALVSK